MQTFVYSTLSFSEPVAYITHNPMWPLSDITEGHSSDHVQLPLKTCRDTLMCEIGGVTL